MLTEISPEYSLEGLLLKLKLQYFGHLTQRTDSLEKTLILGKAGGKGDDRGWDGWMASLTQWTWVWVNSRSWWWTGKPSVLHSMELQSRTRLRDWTELLSSKESTEAMTPEIRMHASSSSPSFCWQLSVKKPTLERPLGWACKSREIFFNLINSRKY